MEGLYICGVVKGVKQVPWKGDQTRFNYFIGVETSFEGSYGETISKVEDVEVYSDSWPMIEPLANSLIGEPVSIPITIRVYNGNNGRDAWYKRVLAKNGTLTKLADVLKKSPENLKIAS